MSFATTYNRPQSAFADVDTTGMKYINLATLNDKYPNAVYRIHGLFINTKGNYGASPAAITDGAIINLPNHTAITVDLILHSDTAIADIKAGKVGIKVRPYVSRNPKAAGRKCYTIDYVDIEPSANTQVITIG